MEENSRTAKEQMNLYRFPYALRDIRVGLERGVKAILAHKLGKGYEDNSLNDNLTVCSRNKIFDQDFTEKSTLQRLIATILHMKIVKRLTNKFISVGQC